MLTSARPSSVTTLSQPIAKLALKRKTDTNLLASARYSGFVDIDNLNKTQSVDQDYESGSGLEEQLTTT